MSKYTIELRWIVEYEESAYSKTDVTNPVYHEGTIKKLGLDTYPIFVENYRSVLNKKIIDHFYFREIGFETAAQFAFYMRRTMNEIMPYYNQLYKSELLELDPLRDVDMWYDTNQTIDNDQKWNQTNTDDYTQDHTENWSVKTDDDLDKNTKEDYTKDNISYTVGHDESVDHTDSRDHNRNVYSDTPMSMLSGDDQGRIENLNYATTVTYDDGTGTTDSTHKDDNTSDTTANEEKHLTGNENSERDINEVGNRTKKDTQDRDMTESGNKSTDEILHNVKHEAGFRQSQAELLQKYRDTFLNIDMMVIKDLEDLFMGVW